MAVINSVLGPLDTADLGFTLMHEHIMCAPQGIIRDYPELLGDNPVARAVDDLKAAKAGGVETIVDATTPDLGRDVALLAEVSRRSGVNIIACAGWWLDVPRLLGGVSADQMAEVFTREIEEGIGGTGIKAGILKSASDSDGVTPQGETILRAVGRAQQRTGVPVMLHSYAPGRVGEAQLAVLKGEGVDLSRVKVDHANDTDDTAYLFGLLEQGCYLGLDRYPGLTLTPQVRTATMKVLLDGGYADRICPSHDRIILRVLEANPEPIFDAYRKQNTHGYLYLREMVFPELRRLGVTEAVMARLCVTAPRNFFEGV